MEDIEHIQNTIEHLLKTWIEISKHLLQDPDTLLNNQFNFFQGYQDLFANPFSTDSLGEDKRFSHSTWNDHLIFNFIKRSYLLLSEHIEHSINEIEKQDERTAKKLRFFSRQMLDAFAPSNFSWTNPDVIIKTFETNGISLLNGFNFFLDDLKKDPHLNHINLSDLDTFKIGENIACTNGKVVFKNDLMQLIQYTSTTDKIYTYPLLIIPPWINKYYILDLQQKNSLVKWLVDQGFTVFMISWVNPDGRYREKQFSDYLLEGPVAALSVIQQITKQSQVNALGYCIGGTLLSCLLAYLHAHQQTFIRSATFLTTLLDFSDAGELSTLLDKNQIQLLEWHMQKKGYLDGSMMAAVFNSLRANDLIWSAFVNSYLKGEKQKPLDLLYWNADSTNIPEKTHSFYLNNMYLNNSLIQANQLSLAGTPLNLRDIHTPSYFLAAQNDHIVPWEACYRGSQLFSGKLKFVLTFSGHVAGVVNPPWQNKYGYWTYSRRPKTAEKYLAGATFCEGSWWPDWAAWLKKYAGRSISKNNLLPLHALENAPGAYVKVSLADIRAAENESDATEAI